jgi:1,4-alpha-glucan branching enzyme
MGYPFCLVLHTHLPMVVNHGRWPHGSDWLCEAAFECYLPLLDSAHRLLADGITPKWTINLSPILVEQLASPEFQKELAFYYENVRKTCAESREHFSREGQHDIVKLTHFWEQFYERMWELHRRIGGDIPGTFADLERQGAVEIITCAATHGYLPLLSRDESIRLQLRTAVAAHTRHFGRAPRGIWLPECAYRPRYEWTAPTGREQGKSRRMRPGIEELLAESGLAYFVADSHLIAASEPIFLYRDYVPLRGQLGDPVVDLPRTKRRTPYAPWKVASRGGSGTAIAFFRDPKTTLQVWSREHGYPGDFAYLEFHKKHHPGGLRFWRITDAGRDLGTKQPYDPAVAAQHVSQQARHFVELVRETAAAGASSDGNAVVCSPYDAELFGHWWFEGPAWLEEVARGFAAAGISAMTLGEALQAISPRGTVALPEGSWGEGGDHRVWLNPDTEWTWDRVYSAETEWVELLSRPRAADTDDVRRLLAQATRELLLLEASDWQFLITTWAARDYAERRVAEHYAEFKRLAEMARAVADGEPLSTEGAGMLRRLERQDFCFPEIDPAWALANGR